MAMGTRKRRQRQEALWYRRDLAQAPGHPFYRRLNEVLDEAGFDQFCETRRRAANDGNREEVTGGRPRLQRETVTQDGRGVL
jgi:hypothetical protein